MDIVHASAMINGIYLADSKEDNELMKFWFMTLRKRLGPQIMRNFGITELRLFIMTNLAQEMDIQPVYSIIRCIYLVAEKNKAR